MRRSIEDIEDILFDGSADDMHSLSSCGVPVSYAYHRDSDSFEVAVGCQRAKMHGPCKVPNCVRIFGPEHTFSL